MELTRLPNGPTVVFPCNAWIGDPAGSCKKQAAEKRLQAAAASAGPGGAALGPLAWYTVHTTTSNVRGADTTSDVYISLTAAHRPSTQRFVLPAAAALSAAFSRGHRDIFRLQMPTLVGAALKSATIGVDGMGARPSWHLDCFDVSEEEGDKRKWHFAADRWLGPAAADGAHEVTLAPTERGPAAVNKEKCTVRIGFSV